MRMWRAVGACTGGRTGSRIGTYSTLPSLGTTASRTNLTPV